MNPYVNTNKSIHMKYQELTKLATTNLMDSKKMLTKVFVIFFKKFRR